MADDARPLRVAGIAALGVGFVFVAALVYWGAFRDDLRSDARNPRLAAALTDPGRGRILDREGEVLAETHPDGRRVYRTAAAAHVVGYLSSRYGAQGAELAFNDELLGRSGGGWAAAIRSELLRTRTHGLDVRLTIDLDVQLAAAAALGARPGAAVALDVRTGDVLAMVSWPAWEPESFPEMGPALLDDPRAPLLNRATQGLYPPGSTFKVVTAAAALTEGLVTPETVVRCEEAYVVSGYVVSCGNVPQGPGTYPFRDAFAYSVNAIFADIGVELGWTSLLRMARAFGFGEPIPFPLPTVASQVVSEGAPLTDVLLASTAFGQGELLVTPLQMALAAATVANGGVLLEPRLLAGVYDGERRTAGPPPTRGRRAVSPEVAAQLREMMIDVVAKGQANISVPGVTVAGKTGTAETGRGTAHAWFIGFAPAESPRVAVAVVVEEGGRGGEVAAPVAGAILEAALRP